MRIAFDSGTVLRAAVRGLLRLGLAASFSGAAVANPFSFVVNHESNDVTVLHPEAGQLDVIATLPVAADPVAIATHPDGRRILVVTTGHLTVIDLITLDRVDIPYPKGWEYGTDVAIHPSGDLAYVSHSPIDAGSAWGYAGVSIVDLNTGTSSEFIRKSYGFKTIALRPDGAFLFGVDLFGDLNQLDMQSLKWAYLFGGRFLDTTNIEIDDWGQIFVGSRLIELVDSFFVPTFGVTYPYPPLIVSNGGQPANLAIDPVYPYAYVTKPSHDVVYGSRFLPTMRLPTGSAPWAIATHPGVPYQMTANLGDATGTAPAGHGSASWLEAGNVVAHAPAGRHPIAVATAVERGIQLLGDPEPLAFAYLQQTPPHRKKLTVVSIGDAEPTISGLRIGGADAQGFRIVGDDCVGTRLAWQGECRVEIEFVAFPKPPPPWYPPGSPWVPSYSAVLEISTEEQGPDRVNPLSLHAGAYVDIPDGKQPPIEPQ